MIVHLLDDLVVGLVFFALVGWLWVLPVTGLLYLLGVL